MAVPKRKVSRARRDKRRSSHWKLAIPGVVACPKCGACLTEPARLAATTMAVKSFLLKLSDFAERDEREAVRLPLFLS